MWLPLYFNLFYSLLNAVSLPLKATAICFFFPRDRLSYSRLTSLRCSVLKGKGRQTAVYHKTSSPLRVVTYMQRPEEVEHNLKCSMGKYHSAPHDQREGKGGGGVDGIAVAIRSLDSVFPCSFTIAQNGYLLILSS
jgi:hypothetical protein